MNLLLTIPFSIRTLEKFIENGEIVNVESPYGKLKRISELINSLPEELRENACTAVDVLKRMYLFLEDDSPKENLRYLFARDNFFARLNKFNLSKISLKVEMEILELLSLIVENLGMV